MDAIFLKRLQTEPFFAFGEVANNNFEGTRSALESVGLIVRNKLEAQTILNDLWLTDKNKLQLVLSKIPYINEPGSRTDGILNDIVEIQSKRKKGCGCNSCKH